MTKCDHEIADYLKSMDLKRPCVSYLAQNIGHEKAVSAMRAEFVRHGQLDLLREHFTAILIAIYAQSKRSSASSRGRRRNIQPLIHTRDQRILERVYFTRRTCSEEGEHGCKMIKVL